MEPKPIKKKTHVRIRSKCIMIFCVLVIVKPNIKINLHNVKKLEIGTHCFFTLLQRLWHKCCIIWVLEKKYYVYKR